VAFFSRVLNEGMLVQMRSWEKAAVIQLRPTHMKSDWILWDPLAMDLNSTPSKSISWGKHHSTMLPAEKQMYLGKRGHSTHF